MARVILLDGASSSGKTTVARALRAALDEPFYWLASDQWVDAGALPDRTHFDWPALRPAFFAGFHRAVAGMAAAGNDLIVDHIVEYLAWRVELADLLAGHDVFLVAVHCDLAELDRREAARGDRRAGEGRAHVEGNRIHTFGPADLDIDTTRGVDDDLIAALLKAWHARAGPSALFTALS